MRLRRCVLLLSGGWLLVAGAAWGVSAGDRCSAAEHGAAASYTRCRLRSVARSLRRGTAADFSACTRRLAWRWRRLARRRVSCGRTEDAAAVVRLAARFTSDVSAVFARPTPATTPVPTATGTATPATTRTSTAVFTATASVTPRASRTWTHTPAATKTATPTLTDPPTTTPTATLAGHLLLSRFVSAPTGAEYVEVRNPASLRVALGDVYLADYPAYYTITGGAGAPRSSDFRLRFPSGSSVEGGASVVISLESASSFEAAYGRWPDYDLDPSDGAAPSMLGEYGASSGLSNGAEMLVLFRWDGSADLVSDLDYVVYGSASAGMDKSGVSAGNSMYAAETAVTEQDAAAAAGAGESLCRVGVDEPGETVVGGNGNSGHDETSEKLSASFAVAGSAAPGGPCP